MRKTKLDLYYFSIAEVANSEGRFSTLDSYNSLRILEGLEPVDSLTGDIYTTWVETLTALDLIDTWHPSNMDWGLLRWIFHEED